MDMPLRAGVVVSVLTLALAAPAGAATVQVASRSDFIGVPAYDVVRLDAVAGERNDLTWSLPAAHTVVLHDAGAPLAPGAGCAAVDASTVSCTTTTMTWQVEAFLGDGADHAAPGDEGTASGAGVVQVHGGTGDDVLRGGDVVSTNLYGEGGNDDLHTGGRYGTADGGEDADVLTGSGYLNGGAGDDRLTAGATRATLTGGIGDDLLTGGPASDSLTGGGGHDTLSGGAGDDSLGDGDGPGYPGGGLPPFDTGPQPVDADVLDGGPGRDALEYGLRTQGVSADLRGGTAGQAGEGDRISGFENVDGGRGADRLTGTDDVNRISGGGGRDDIRALTGDDTVYADHAAAIRLGAGDDVLWLSRYGVNDRSGGHADCGSGSDLVRYPDPTHRAPVNCETFGLRLWATIHRVDTARPGVQCGPFRRRPGSTPCTFRLRMVLPARRGDGYAPGGTPLGATAWRAVPVDATRTFALRLGPWGRAQLRARGSLPVRVILERRTGTRSRGYAVGSYVTVLHR